MTLLQNDQLIVPTNLRYMFTRVIQKVLSLTQIFKLLYTYRLCIGLTCSEIKIEIWMSFFLVL